MKVIHYISFILGIMFGVIGAIEFYGDTVWTTFAAFGLCAVFSVIYVASDRRTKDVVDDEPPIWTDRAEVVSDEMTSWDEAYKIAQSTKTVSDWDDMTVEELQELLK